MLPSFVGYPERLIRYGHIDRLVENILICTEPAYWKFSRATALNDSWRLSPAGTAKTLYSGRRSGAIGGNVRCGFAVAASSSRGTAAAPPGKQEAQSNSTEKLTAPIHVRFLLGLINSCRRPSN
jgi:hypothetical protein